MKKALILIVLIALPISIYIIFATAVHHFSYLPTLTKNVGTLEDLTPMQGDTLSFDDTVTVLTFYGNHIKDMRGYAYNLHEKIYKKNYIYKDFQILTIAEKGQEEKARELINDLGEFTDVNMIKWRFAFGDSLEIHNLFNRLKTDLSLNENNATPYAFIIDKEGNLRGHKDKKDENTVDYGYVTGSIAALNNEMVGDVSIVLAEYRLKENQEKNNILKYNQEK